MMTLDELSAMIDGQRDYIETIIREWYQADTDRLDDAMRKVYRHYIRGIPAAQREFFEISKCKEVMNHDILTLVNQVVIAYNQTLGPVVDAGGFGITPATLQESLDIYLNHLGVRIGKLEGACLSDMAGFTTH